MHTSRLITFLTALPDHAVRRLPDWERHQLARECKRLLEASQDVDRAYPPKAGVLAQLRNGERQG